VTARKVRRENQFLLTCESGTALRFPLQLDDVLGVADARPALVQTALALARIMDNPKATNQQPAAAKVPAAMLEKLHSASARGRRGNLSVVKSMTSSPPAHC
jgi:hypothetical protein